jgi:HSF-type DNA-binding
MPLTTKRKGSSFPMKLFKILWDADKGHHHREVISWLPDGKSFKIYSEQRFREQVMGRYFTQTNFKSFTRQLYLYGFLKMSSSDPDSGVFYHPCFIRSDPQACVTIKRNQFEGDRRLSKIRVSIEGSLPRTESSGKAADKNAPPETCLALYQAALSPALPTGSTSRSHGFSNESSWSDEKDYDLEFLPIMNILDEACLLTEVGDYHLIPPTASCASQESETLDDLFLEIQSTFASTSNQVLEIDYDLFLEPRPIEEMLRLPRLK